MAEDKFEGRKLDDRYLLQRRLDAGSFGAVYEAVDLKFDSTVAVKILFEQSMESASSFRKEARLARQFKHSNVVTVFDYGSDSKTDVGYIVMEFLKGCRVDQLITPGEATISDRVIAKFTDEVGSALQSAHERQLVHRDLKPRNVMLVDEGTSHERFVLLDLGLASQTDSTATLRNQTLDGAMTPHYASPEQFNQGAVDFKSDIYSFGTVLYELITGTIPFPREQLLGMMMAICNDPPSPPSEVARGRQIPAELEAVVLHCLEKKPENRPESMQVVRERVLSSMGFATGFYDVIPQGTSHPGGHSTLDPTRHGPAARDSSGSGSGMSDSFEFEDTVLPGHSGSGSDISRTAQPVIGRQTDITGTLQPIIGAGSEVTGTMQPGGTGGFATGDTSPSADRRSGSWARSQNRRAAPSKRPYALIALFLTPVIAVAAYLISIGPDPKPNPPPNPDPPLVGVNPDKGDQGGEPEPAVWSPPEGFQVVPGYDPVFSKDDQQRYPLLIDRVINSNLSVRFRLILPPENASREWRVQPFYIMETMVWNKLFEHYWQEAGAEQFPDAEHEAWKLGGKAGGDDLPAHEHLQHPVLRMQVLQAHHFAVWLAGENSCHLPSVEQWKLAAGLPQWDLWSEEERTEWPEGPYRGQWGSGSLDIAVGRSDQGPADVGTSQDDVSLNQCRDMAGNGAELTENMNFGGTIGASPPSEDAQLAKPQVLVLGQEYNMHEPLTWSELRKPFLQGSTGYSAVDPFIGFRVVLETN